jgi:hypothetical protein
MMLSSKIEDVRGSAGRTGITGMFKQRDLVGGKSATTKEPRMVG